MIEKVVNRKNLLKAYQAVLSNKGAAGVDGMANELDLLVPGHRVALVVEGFQRG